MEKIIFSKERNIENNIITLKTVNDYKEFREVLKVFSGYPYYEILSDKDCKDEYELYLEKGIVIGHYINDVISGINCIVYEQDDKHSIKFDDNDLIAYHSGFAVKENLRNHGIGKTLIKTTEEFLTDSNKFNYEYARILCEGSMSERIFQKYGFVDAYDKNNNLIVDDVGYMDSNGKLHQDKRKYMVKTLKKGSGFDRR